MPHEISLYWLPQSLQNALCLLCHAYRSELSQFEYRCDRNYGWLQQYCTVYLGNDGGNYLFAKMFTQFRKDTYIRNSNTCVPCRLTQGLLQSWLHYK